MCVHGEACQGQITAEHMWSEEGGEQGKERKDKERKGEKLRGIKRKEMRGKKKRNHKDL